MRFKDLTEAQIMVLAIANEEEDSTILRDFTELFREEYPSTSELFLKITNEGNELQPKLIDEYKSTFGQPILFIRRQDTGGFR